MDTNKIEKDWNESDLHECSYFLNDYLNDARLEEDFNSYDLAVEHFDIDDFRYWLNDKFDEDFLMTYVLKPGGILSQEEVDILYTKVCEYIISEAEKDIDVMKTDIHCDIAKAERNKYPYNEGRKQYQYININAMKYEKEGEI